MTGLKSTLFLLLFCPFSINLQAQPDDQIDWLYEIDLLGKELEKRHNNLFFQKDSDYFYGALDRIAANASNHSLFAVSVQLQQVIASLGDAQTRINYHFNIESNSILPMDFYWFDDGIFVLRSKAEHKEILGKKLTGINGFPLSEIIDSLATLVVNENQFLLKSQIPRMLTWTPLLEYFGFTNGKSFYLEYKTRNKEINSLHVLLPVEDGADLSVPTEKLPLGWQDQKSFFWDQYLDEDQIYYIQYNKCWSREMEEEFGTGASALFMPSFKEFEKRVFRTIKNQKIDKLIFDMRFNSGGNASQGTKFIKKLNKTRYNGNGKFYVIVGRETFSSAIINTLDFTKNNNTIVVGEGTGGKPNHYGEILRFVLPESKLVVNHSTKYFTLLEEDVPAIIPHIISTISFGQYMNGTDPAIDAIKNHH